MTLSFKIVPAATQADYRDVAVLFLLYAASLPIDLGYQGFDAEIAELPGKYDRPAGELLLGRATDGEPLACVGLRPLGSDGCCEMKRLFVQPKGRALGIGHAMAEAIVAVAKARGYAELRLDTLASMSGAMRLYSRIGFQPIDPYYSPTPPGTLFMALGLRPEPRPTR